MRCSSKNEALGNVHAALARKIGCTPWIRSCLTETHLLKFTQHVLLARYDSSISHTQLPSAHYEEVLLVESDDAARGQGLHFFVPVRFSQQPATHTTTSVG